VAGYAGGMGRECSRGRIRKSEGNGQKPRKNRTRTWKQNIRKSIRTLPTTTVLHRVKNIVLFSDR
jgi:hypothetical protein